LTALVVTAVLALGGGVLAAGMVLPAVGAVDTTTKAARDVIDAIPVDLDVPVLSQKSYMYDGAGNLLTEFYAQNRIVVSLDDIAESMQQAVVALEDRRFWEHSGVDMQGMFRALANNAADGSTQGASTITQQYIKNVLIEQAVQDRDFEAIEAAKEISYARKLKEARRAVAFEKKVGKKKVLEGYLNIAQFGKSVYGVESAANYYFGVSAKDLTIVQSATIAAITQSPNTLDPVVNPEMNKERRDDALDALLRDGYITQEEHDEAIAVDVTESLNVTPTESGCEVADSKAGAGFFCEYVVALIRNSEQFGETKEARQQLLNRGGLHVYTTLDPKMQAAAKIAVDTREKPEAGYGNGVALSAVEPGTGLVKAMAQNRAYRFEAAEATATAVNFNVSYDLGGATGFQTGSSFKPVILAQWLTDGHSLYEGFDPSRTSYSGSRWKDRCLDGGIYTVGNWSIKGGTGASTAMAATAASANAAYAAMEHKLDLCDVEDMAKRMGIERADGTAWHRDPSQVFGANEVAPLAMAAGYASFAADGMYCEPNPIVKITDNADEVIAEPEPVCARAMTEDVARGVTKALRGVISGGTGTQAYLEGGRQVAGKTGTTDNSMAIWFCGYTPQLATAVWAGNPAAASAGLQGDLRGGFGGQYMASAFKWFMDPAMDGLPHRYFTEPSWEMTKGRMLSVPSVIGMGVEDAKATLEGQGFRAYVSGATVESQYGAGVVAAQSPSAGGEAYPGASVTLTLSSGPPPAAGGGGGGGGGGGRPPPPSPPPGGGGIGTH